MTFEAWKAEVNRIVASVLDGLNTDDLVDMPYRDEYRDGTTPGDMAYMALEANGFYR